MNRENEKKMHSFFFSIFALFSIKWKREISVLHFFPQFRYYNSKKNFFWERENVYEIFLSNFFFCSYSNYKRFFSFLEEKN